MNFEPLSFHPESLVKGGEPLELAPRAYAVPLLTEDGCEALLAEIQSRRDRASELALEPPSSMHDHGVRFADIGLESWVDEFLSAGIRPWTELLFASAFGAELDHHHAYLVEYGRDHDEDLGFHVDDSEITVNLCLGESFRGAELTLLGERCPLHRQSPVRGDERVTVEHDVGVAILHGGAHRHQVEPILRGTRKNLIVWCRSGTARATGSAPHQIETCPEWCGART